MNTLVFGVSLVQQIDDRSKNVTIKKKNPEKKIEKIFAITDFVRV